MTHCTPIAAPANPCAGLAFALIINGPDAPAPAPRCAVAVAECAGLYHRERRESYRPDYESFRAALPPYLRRYVTAKREPFPSLWFRKGVQFSEGETRGDLPYYTVRKANGDYVATVYCALVETPPD